MMQVIIPFLVLSLLGGMFAVLLTFANRMLLVKGDPRVEMFLSLLPGSNCGACGFAGCLGLAESLAKGESEPTACLAGGPAVAAKIAEAMGISLEAQTEQVAFVACKAGRNISKKKYTYAGVEDCQAASLLFGGDKACAYGCIGLGSCASVCPFDAIDITPDGLAVVNENCRGCQQCVKACPFGLISMVPKHQTVFVGCNNLDKGRVAKELCSIACIACKICEKNCPEKAITVINNLAVIDYSKCTQCGICVEKCPQKIIIRVGQKAAA